MTTLADIAARAHEHLGEPGPDDTCVSNGMNRWPKELGLPGIDTASVTEARRLAKAGHNGWRYHPGLAGLRVGHFVDWATIFHVSVVTDIDPRGYVRTIGSGGPSGKVAWQPAGGGYNSPHVFRGYFIPPTGSGAQAAPTYTLKHGDTLYAIAEHHHTTWQHLAQLNGIRDVRDLQVGQVIKLP